MTSVTGNKQTASTYWNEENEQVKIIAEEMASSIDESSHEILKKGTLTPSQLDSIYTRIEQIATQAEKSLGKEVSLQNPQVQEFVKTQISGILTSIIETVKNQEPDLIREAGVSEAVFSYKGDYRPILATDSLATCIGVAGYDPMNQFGFVIHFANKNEVEASKATLLKRICEYKAKNPQAPLLVHLRGGIKGLSEPLLSEVKQWLLEKEMNCIIASEDTLQQETNGLPSPGSIKLDVRTGTCEKYDPETNPYTKIKRKEVSEHTPNFMADLWLKTATRKPEIKIVYDPKSS